MGTIFPFYAAANPELFAIERAAMDRPGKVIAALDALLPAGTILDIGAGDGFTAAALHTPQRTIVGLDPATDPMRRDRPVRWVAGEAEHLPFADDCVDAAYATWAYFFTRDFDPAPGLAEVERVVRPGGRFVMVDNLGDDEFCAMADRDITCDPQWWLRRGFSLTEIDTVFAFDDIDAARTLLAFYFGEHGARHADLEIHYRVGVFAKDV